MSKKGMSITGKVTDIWSNRHRVIVFVKAISPQNVQGKTVRFCTGTYENVSMSLPDWSGLAVGDEVQIISTYNPYPYECQMDYKLNVLHSKVLNA